MTDRKKYIIALIAVLPLLMAAQPVKAAVRCETQYGGGEICLRTGELQINKQVCDPPSDDKGNFRNCNIENGVIKDSLKDNFWISDRKFKTNEEVVFKLTIKNVGDETINDITVTDTLPSYLFFTDGSTGTFKIDQMNPHTEVEKIIRTRVVSDSQLAADTTCIVNVAEVKSGDEHDKDTAQICITKKVTEVTTLPKTGPSMIFWAPVATFIAGVIGLILLKFNRKP